MPAAVPAEELVRPDRRIVVPAVGIIQVLTWGSTFYLLGVLARPIAEDTGWNYDWVIAGVSIGLLVAGLISPRVGRTIGRHGGRTVLASSALALATGLSLLGLAPNFACYAAAWLFIGAGMGCGLYDAAFSTLGSIYGKDARGAITWVTLFGGFASTVCWPLSAYLVSQFGWRGTCFVYAAIHIGIVLPLALIFLPRRSFVARPAEGTGSGADAVRLKPDELPIFAILAVVLTLGAAILAIMGVHLLPLLQARGLTLAAAVALGAIVGPSQVAARVVEMFAGRHYPPIWTMIASTILVSAGTALFYFGFPYYAAVVILYGAGNGIGSVARGTLPLWLFGPDRYPALMGRLALPILLAMALAPFLGAVAFQSGGADQTLALLATLAAVNVVLVVLLWLFNHRRTGAQQA